MVTIYTCLVAQHDWRLVLVAVAICLLGSVVSVALWRHVARVRGRRRAAWLALAAATAAAAVWATHFVAMLAHEVRLEQGLSPSLTLLSFLVALALMAPASLLLDRARRDRRWILPAGAALTGAVGSMHYAGMAAYRDGAWMAWDASLVAASLAAGGRCSPPRPRASPRGARWCDASRRRRSSRWGSRRCTSRG